MAQSSLLVLPGLASPVGDLIPKGSFSCYGTFDPLGGRSKQGNAGSKNLLTCGVRADFQVSSLLKSFLMKALAKSSGGLPSKLTCTGRTEAALCLPASSFSLGSAIASLTLQSAGSEEQTAGDLSLSPGSPPTLQSLSFLAGPNGRTSI